MYYEDCKSVSCATKKHHEDTKRENTAAHTSMSIQDVYADPSSFSRPKIALRTLPGVNLGSPVFASSAPTTSTHFTPIACHAYTSTSSPPRTHSHTLTVIACTSTGTDVPLKYNICVTYADTGYVVSPCPMPSYCRWYGVFSVRAITLRVVSPVVRYKLRDGA